MCAWILLVAWCAWVVLVRPQVSVDGDHVVLRNSLVDLRIPARLVDDVTIRAYLVLRVGKKRYTSTAVGYRPSSVARGHADLARGLVTDDGRTRIENPVAYTEEYLRTEVARAKRAPGAGEDGRVVRSVASLPIVTFLSIVAVIVGTTFGVR